MTLLARASAAIRARRQELRLKQSEVAKAAGMSLRRYITIEHGGNFTLDKLERIAIALDASRSQRIHAIQCARHKQRLIITAPDVEDLSVEQLAIRQGSGMFEDVFGLKVQLRRAERPQLRGSTSQL